MKKWQQNSQIPIKNWQSKKRKISWLLGALCKCNKILLQLCPSTSDISNDNPNQISEKHLKQQRFKDAKFLLLFD